MRWAATESVKQRAPAALSSAVAFIIGFVPWIVYWILVGNAPFLTAVLALAVVINLSSLVRRQPPMVLEAGTAMVFAIFVIMALTLSDNFLERWLLPVGNAGLFVIILISILIGKPIHSAVRPQIHTARAMGRAWVCVRVPAAGLHRRIHIDQEVMREMIRGVRSA